MINIFKFYWIDYGRSGGNKSLHLNIFCTAPSRKWEAQSKNVWPKNFPYIPKFRKQGIIEGIYQVSEMCGICLFKKMLSRRNCLKFFKAANKCGI